MSRTAVASCKVWRVSDASACRCRRCAGFTGYGPHRTGYWRAYALSADGRQDGPCADGWTRGEAVAAAMAAATGGAE